MTPISSASFRPFVPAKFADAPVNDPVCIQTITGAPPAGSGFLTQTFSFRQSSEPWGVVPFRDAQLPVPAVTGSVVVHGVTGCGGFQRFWPPVVAAKGIPKNPHVVP